MATSARSGCLLQFGNEPIGPVAQLLIVDVLENVLVLSSGLPGFDLDILHRLQMQRYVVDARDAARNRSMISAADACRRSGDPMSI